jgi:hypothetical protein
VHSARFQHDLAAPLLDVERVLLAPATLPVLTAALPEVASAEEVERVDDGTHVLRAARHVARLTPPGFGRMIEGPHLAWIEEVRWDRAAHGGTFRIVPNLRSERRHLFRCEGTYRLDPIQGGTRRTVEVEVAIAVRIVGPPPVERLVLAQLEPHLGVEAEVIERLARSRAS